ncbi:hypothetical protein BQ6471_03283 [Vibrio gazogenes]|nr:hypothetical protein BQ6471_03283 [Vibrio gazogenes]
MLIREQMELIRDVHGGENVSESFVSELDSVVL